MQRHRLCDVMANVLDYDIIVCKFTFGQIFLEKYEFPYHLSYE